MSTTEVTTLQAIQHPTRHDADSPVTSDDQGHCASPDTQHGSGIALVGFAFIQAWQMIAYASGYFTGAVASCLALPFIPLAHYIVLAIILCIPVCIRSLIREPNLIPRRIFLICAVSVAATACLYSARFITGGPSAAFFLIGALAAGFSDVYLILTWVLYWGTTANGYVIKSICLSYVVAFIIYHTFAFLPGAAQIVVVALLLPCSAICLARGNDEPKRPFTCPDMPKRPASASEARFIAGIILLHVLFGVLQSANIRLVATSDLIAPVAGGFNFNTSILAGILIALVTLAIYDRESPDTCIDALYRACVAFSILSTASFMVQVEAIRLVAFGFFRAAMFALDALTIILVTDYAYKTKSNPVLLYGLLLIGTRMASLIGVAAAQVPFTYFEVPKVAEMSRHEFAFAKRLLASMPVPR